MNIYTFTAAEPIDTVNTTDTTVIYLFRYS